MIGNDDSDNDDNADADADADEELQQPRRRIPTVVLPTLAAVVVAAGLIIGVTRGNDRAPNLRPPASPTTSGVLTAAPESSKAAAVVDPPTGLLRAVAAAYPAAVLVEFGTAVPARAGADRNYQFFAGARRITVVVGPIDTRPEVQATNRRDVLVVAKRSGHRVAVSVRIVRGTLRHADLVKARSLARDSRLLATD